MLYFIQNTDSGAIKIGTALEIKQRLADLQIASPDELELIGSCPGGRDEERAVHERLSLYRIRGEWFRPHAAVLRLMRQLTAGEPPLPPQEAVRNLPRRDMRQDTMREGVTDALDFWLSQHDVTMAELVEIAFRKALEPWLATHPRLMAKAIRAAAERSGLLLFTGAAPHPRRKAVALRRFVRLAAVRRLARPNAKRQGASLGR